MIAVATAAVREAEDGPAFCDQVERETGLQLHVASGSEEARLAAKGVLARLAGRRGPGLRHGRRLDGARAGHGGDDPRLRDLAARAAEARRHHATTTSARRRSASGVKALRRRCPGRRPRLFLVGGSWRAIARLDMERIGYPLKVLHGYEPPIAAAARDAATGSAKQDQAAMSSMTGTSTQRLSLVPLASRGAGRAAAARSSPRRVAVSAYGLREGLLYRQMPEPMRVLDPLIEACRHMEAGLGAQPRLRRRALRVAAAALPGPARAPRLRLMHAACLLHDVNWRAHPDYRAELCFESVTRANIAGHRPSRAGLPRAGAAQPLQGGGAGRGGGALRRAAAAGAGGGGGGARPGDAARGDALGLGDRRARACRASRARAAGWC